MAWIIQFRKSVKVNTRQSGKRKEREGRGETSHEEDGTLIPRCRQNIKEDLENKIAGVF